ncbi:MAG: ATP-binding protein [Pseudomonadota bacterium]
MTRFGLITRIALLVIGVEVAAFSALGWFYVDRFSDAIDERARSGLHLIGRMISTDELAIHALSREALISEMVGAPYQGGMVIGGNGRVIVSTDPSQLGRLARELPSFDPRWLDNDAPDEQFIRGQNSLTGVMRIHGSVGTPLLYTTVIRIDTHELDTRKRFITFWGQAASLLFILFSSAAIVLIAQRLITKRIDTSLAILKQVEEGALNARIPVNAADELGQLQQGINSMTGKLSTLLVQHRRNEEALVAILNAIRDAVLAVGPDGRVTRLNPGAQAMFGLRSDQSPRVADLLPDLAAPDSASGWRLPPPGAKPARPELTLRDPEGRLRTLEIGSGQITEADGTEAGAVLVLRDITDRKLAEEQVRATSRLLDSVVENIPNMIFLKRAEDLRFVLFNKAGEDLLGHPRVHLLGKNDYDLFPPAQADFFTAKDREVLTGPGQLDIPEETITTRLHGERILHTKKLALRDERGQVLYLLGISEDITERKRTLEELERHRNHLEQLVMERTEQLSRAKENAEAANRSKSIFLANMSHELRTPLNAILGFAQLLARDTRIPADAQSNLATINRAGNHLLTLINDVLEITRIEAGRTALARQDFDLDATLQTVTDMIRVRAEAKGLALHVERLGPLPDHVNGDAHRLRQVLINLLGNAVKYTDQGDVVLRIEALTAPTVQFTVSDSGPGIATEDQERVFQAFFQTDAGIAKGEGTGLGLTISREFVRLMGGELTLESAPGQGTRFSFMIDLPEAEAEANTPYPGRVIGIAAPARTLRVLVVEDHPESRELLTRLLQQVGFEVHSAADGQAGLAAFDAVHPDFVWMDMRMPVMDGYEATRRLRARPGGNAVRIAAITASAFEEDRGAILAAGCDEVVRKPLEEARVFEVMGRLLDLRFIHAQETRPAETRHDQDLGHLPADLRGELVAAAARLDQEATLALVQRLRSEYPAEAETIAELARNFAYDKLIALGED